MTRKRPVVQQVDAVGLAAQTLTLADRLPSEVERALEFVLEQPLETPARPARSRS